MHFSALVALAVVASFVPSLAAPTPYSPHGVTSERDRALTGLQFEDPSNESPASVESVVQGMGQIAQLMAELGSLEEISRLADSQNNMQDLSQTVSGIKIKSILKVVGEIAFVMILLK
ncbi:hypothetical protein BDR07DRAFT_1375203 [Suillus spraguei]|nr:hypothetical protein BDR07DRAFT_1375203 [Suillus spraguei]